MCNILHGAIHPIVQMITPIVLDINNDSCRLFAVPYFFVRSSGLSTNTCTGTVGLLGFLCHYGIPPISWSTLPVKFWVPISPFASSQRMPTRVTSFDARMKRKLIVSTIQLR